MGCLLPARLHCTGLTFSPGGLTDHIPLATYVGTKVHHRNKNARPLLLLGWRMLSGRPQNPIIGPREYEHCSEKRSLHVYRAQCLVAKITTTTTPPDESMQPALGVHFPPRVVVGRQGRMLAAGWAVVPPKADIRAAVSRSVTCIMCSPVRAVGDGTTMYVLSAAVLLSHHNLIITHTTTPKLLHLSVYHGTGPSTLVKVFVSPSGPSVANRHAFIAPCSGAFVPAYEFRFVPQ